MNMSENKIYQTLFEEYRNQYKNGLYHKTQILFAYNSNHIEGSTLSEEQTRSIFETNSFIANKEQIIKANDILEAKNHFKAFDFILENANKNISIELIKQLHSIVKKDCSDIKIIGNFKKQQNFVGDIKTTPPQFVNTQIQKLLDSYNENQNKTIKELIDFHFHFEKIHPFEDGNGRVGRLLMFKECLKENIIPFIIDEKHKLFYYRGLREYENHQGYLIETCLSCQDDYQNLLNYFGIDLTQKKQFISQNQNPHNEPKKANLSLKEINAKLDEATQKQNLRASKPKPNSQKQEYIEKNNENLENSNNQNSNKKLNKRK